MVIRVKPNLIDAPGTPEAAWRAWRGLNLLPIADTKGWASVVLVAAHPDDEVLGAGGTISELAARNARLRLVAVTDGEASYRDGPAAGRRATLARRRAADRQASRRTLFCPVWMWHWAQPGDIRVPWHSAVRVPLPRSTVACKRRAISRFASQLQDRSPQTGPVLPAEIVAHFVRDYEVFFQVSQP